MKQFTVGSVASSLNDAGHVQPTPDFSSISAYQQLHPWAHTCWKQGRSAESVPMLWAAISRFPYAVALKQPLALSLVGSADSSDDESARVEIEKLFTLACVFRDHELLSRFGRIYKDKGDRLLGENMSHQEFLNRQPPSYRHYLAALHRILPEETGTIVGIHKQLRRLQWALGADIVGPVIERLRLYP